jgi:hypothetical protein
MVKKKVNRSVKEKSIKLTINQVAHIINGSIKNLIDLKTNESEEDHRFLLILDCLTKEDCIPVTQEPKTDQQYVDIICAHAIDELDRFIEVILPVKGSDGNFYRGFSTVKINDSNIASFLAALAELEDYWMGVDGRIQEEEDLQAKIKGLNIVQGNDTVN